MDKRIAKLLIAENQRMIQNVEMVKRNISFESHSNYVLVGLRRAGKSYLLYQRAQEMIAQGHLPEEILYFNFEDDRLENLQLSDLDAIKQAYEEMYGHQPIFMLDEIQIIDGWEKFARRLADQKYRVYITGSNAKMLSSEIATTLGGRYLIKNVYPFSFNEYLSFRKVDMADKNAIYKYRSGIMRSFEEYFYGGGLPETLLMKDKRSWISSLFNKIFFGDLVARHQIRNDFALKLMIRKLAESVKQPTSYNRIANIVSTAGKKISVDTVIDYIAYLRESWLILPFENLSARLSERESNKKYYFVDNGLLGLFLIDANTSLLENIVAISLRKQYEDNVFFYNKNIEVDFVVPDDGLAIQVAYSLADPTTEKRETDALMKFNAIMPMRQLIIITKDEEMVIEKDGTVINVLPVWKWLLR